MKILALIAKFWLIATGVIVAIGLFFFGLYFIYHKNNNSYVIENGSVFYKSGKFPNYNSTKIENVDIPTFKTIKYPYAKDANRVYYQGGILEGCNPESFEFINFNWRYSKDGQYVYWHRSLISEDPKNFVIIKKALAKDSRQVFRGTQILLDADPHTFETLGNDYHRDKNAVFFSFHKIEGVSPTTFSLVPEDPELGRDGNKLFRKGIAIDSEYKRLDHDYTVDSQHAKYKEEVIPGADSKTFEVIFNQLNAYAKDSTQVYFGGTLIREADPTTFEVLGGGYGFARDNRFAFYDEKKIQGAHGPSFEVLDMFPTIARDQSFAYTNNGARIEGINGATLRRLNEDYATDGVKVIYEGKVIPEADGATFKLVFSAKYIDFKEGQDKNQKFRFGKPVALLVREEQ